jgi:hypothetical protein
MALPILAKLLGHSEGTDTLVYIHTSLEKEIADYDSTIDLKRL